MTTGRVHVSSEVSRFVWQFPFWHEQQQALLWPQESNVSFSAVFCNYGSDVIVYFYNHSVTSPTGFKTHTFMDGHVTGTTSCGDWWGSRSTIHLLSGSCRRLFPSPYKELQTQTGLLEKTCFVENHWSTPRWMGTQDVFCFMDLQVTVMLRVLCEMCSWELL